MSINVVGHGFEILTGNVDEGQNVDYKYNGNQSACGVGGFNDQEAKRGWKQLDSGNGDVSAWRVNNTVVLLRRPGQDFMGQLPDERSLADVTLAGTHESCSTSGGFISECQTGDIAQQLEDGVRFLDIRLKVVNNELQTFHGIQPMNSTLKQQVEWIENFLRAHPRETVVVSIKQEQEDNPDFGNKVYDLINSSGLWRFAGDIPKLGDVRGKAILFSRYNAQYSEGAGIHPTTWPDSVKEGFEWDCYGTPFRIEDWYNIPNASAVGDKAQCVIDHLSPTVEGRGGDGTGGGHPFSLTFATASKFPDANPRWVSSASSSGGLAGLLGNTSSFFANFTKQPEGNGNGGGNSGEVGVNARLVRWLLERAAEGKRPRATVMLDFYRDNMADDRNLATLLAALNFATDN